MTNLIRRGLAWVSGNRKEFNSEQIFYSVAPGECIVIADATVGHTHFKQFDSQGVLIRVSARDFIVDVNALPQEPNDGDQITFEDFVYEVTPMNDEPAWRYTDGYNRSYRIHTKQLGPVDE